MKAYLEFELPEDKDQFTLATKGDDLWSCLWDFDQWLRDQIKYHNKDYDDIRGKLRDIMYGNDVNLDMV